MKILVNTRSLLATLDQEVDGMAFDASDKNRISAALFDVALDHAEGIVLLLENKIYASAYSLSRSLFETFVRATWIQHCATDSEVNRVIKKDEFKLTFGEMLDAVEKRREWGKTLTIMKQQVWKSMNSYTHGGLQIVSRRFKGDYIEHVVDENEIMGLLQIVGAVSFLSFTQMVEMSNAPNKKDEVLNRLLEDLSIWCFTDKKERMR